MKRKLIIAVPVALIVLLAGVVLFVICGTGSGVVQRWIGDQLGTLASQYLNPRLSMGAVRYQHPLVRIGYDDIAGFFSGGLVPWEKSGRSYGRIPAVHATELPRRVQEKEEFTLLDVRYIEEYDSGHLPGAVNVYVGELPDRLNEVPGDRPVTTFCRSGRRAIIAASVLKQNGFDDVEDSLGSMSACSAVGCPVAQGAGT